MKFAIRLAATLSVAALLSACGTNETDTKDKKAGSGEAEEAAFDGVAQRARGESLEGALRERSRVVVPRRTPRLQEQQHGRDRELGRPAEPAELAVLEPDELGHGVAEVGAPVMVQAAPD